VLCKPGRFEPHEYELMKKHSEYGASVLRRAEAKLSFASFLRTAIDIAQSHHERWDGKGYPTGLQGEDIPLSARIMAVADIYDALRSRRRYKGPFPHEECCELIAQDAGKALDPLVVEAFLRQEKVFLEVSRRLAD
jgi:putative two-component system response regulator